MENSYWHQKWNAHEIGFNQLQPNQLLQRYCHTLNLQPGDRVFVPLCGKSIDMLWLIQQGYHVIGVELSLMACESFFSDYNLPVKTIQTESHTIFQSENITLYASDFFQLNKALIGDITAVYDRAALIALPATLRRRYVDYLISLLCPSTKILLITTVYNQSEMPGPPFSVDRNEIETLYGTYLHIDLLYDNPIQKIPEHLRKRGLSDATEHAFLLALK